MVKYFDSIAPDLQQWALQQSVFFVASAPLHGRHINVSPKGLPSSSFAILGPNEAAYVDATGSGNETISHLRENGRVTVMFCSFDAAPRILRFFCTGSVIEWNEPDFPRWLARMEGKRVDGARAVIRLDVFKVQTSCGYAVPTLALMTDPVTQAATPYFQDRDTLGHFARKKVEKGEMREYQRIWNHDSLDGLPGLKSAERDNGGWVWLSDARNSMHRHRDLVERTKTALLMLFVLLATAQWVGYL